MKTVRMACLLFVAVITWGMPLISTAEDTTAPSPASGGGLDLDQILNHIEQRYAGPGFSAEFKQESTIKAMAITDTAAGRVFIKRPDRMRWEYTEPESQIIISDGTRLWVYRPDDNQVMVGEAPAFFGGGKGAGFLTDIYAIRQDFEVDRVREKENGHYVLKLIPRKKTPELLEVLLFISKETFDVARVVTYNTYGDETRIDLLNQKLNVDASPELFKFSVPDGVEVLELES